VRTLGKRVKGNLSGVQIPYPPQIEIKQGDSDEDQIIIYGNRAARFNG
jgi:hypothetical protein